MCSVYEFQNRVDRRIGGLEINQPVFIVHIAVDRRIGGLERLNQPSL